jgi:ribonucleoside-diphosphate reductase alpha chain/ribonucleoside-triphosphate reductase
MGITPPSWFEDLSVKSYDAEVNGSSPFHVGRMGIAHRRLSNNSLSFEEKPSPDFLHLVFLMIQLDGEPGFINLEAARKRRDNMQGVNPCGEILLDSKQQCNLTTVNLCAFLSESGFDLDAAMHAQTLSARAGLRMTLIDLELPEWNEKHKRDRLTGCSLTGVQDAFAFMNEQEQINVLKSLSICALTAAEKYAHDLRIPSPLLTTTIKPEGTISLVAGGVSAGLHNSHAPYFIRRIRISSDDALAKTAIALGWKVHPEVGTPGNTIENARTLVIDFPIASGARETKGDVPALTQLDRYVQFQKYYTQHNSSNTITVKPQEWPEIEDAIAKVWDTFVGVSFLAYDGGTYKLAPYETITKEQYEILLREFMPFDPALLMAYEDIGVSNDAEDDDCTSGACPIR